MQFKAFSKSTKNYSILLLISVGILLFAEGLTFKQIGLLRESADQVAQSLEVEMAIDDLFSHYSQMQAEALGNLLVQQEFEDTAWNDQKNQTFTSYNTLENLVGDNQPLSDKLHEIRRLQNTLYRSFQTLEMVKPDSISEHRTEAILAVTAALDAIGEAKDQMLEAERELIVQRKAEFDSQADIAPLFTLLLALFALAIILLAFARIYRNKQRIRRSQEFLKSILRNTTNIVNYYEPIYDESGEVADFRVIFANECNKTYLGVDPEKIVGRSVSSVFPFLRLNGELSTLIKSFKEHRPAYLDRQIAGPDKKMWFKSTIVPHDNGLLVTGTNATKEKEDEEKLRDLNDQLRDQNEELIRAEAFLEGILRSTKNVIMSFEPIWKDAGTISDFRLLFINQKVNGIIDTEASKLVGGNVSEISPFIFQSDIFKHMVKSYMNEKPVDFECPYSRDGVQNWLQGTAIKRYNLITLNLVDITKLMDAERHLRSNNLQLKQINEELESFNRVASHDLQEPLRKIRLFLSRIFDSEKEKFSKKETEYLNKVNKAAERMQSLIHNLLAYSRIDNSHENFQEVDLNGILKKVKDDLALSIKESGAEIKQDKLPTIKGVSFQMEQLFANLLSNALKYRRPLSQARISLKVELVPRGQIKEDFVKSAKKYYKIALQDNGIGFDPEYAGKIFEVFQRLHQKTEYSGTGIGLAICKKIVENHLGHIQAIGAPGEGSTFIVYLPE